MDGTRVKDLAGSSGDWAYPCQYIPPEHFPFPTPMDPTQKRVNHQSCRAVMWGVDQIGALWAGALALLLAAGILFRSWGVLTGTLDFWADEAWWAVKTAEQPLLAPSIRPIGYMWLSKGLLQIGNPELLLRLPSYIAGIGVVACVGLCALRLFKSRIVVLFVVLVCVLHPKLIVFAKEFKPYSLEAFIHSGVTLWALVCWQRRRASSAFWIASAIALPFCYNIVFLYPALILVLVAPQFLGQAQILVIRRYIARHVDRRLLLVFVLAAGMACLLLSDAFVSDRKLFWGNKYGVFPIELGVLETLVWYGTKTWTLLTQPASLHGVDPAVQAFLRPIFFTAYTLGVIALARKRRYAELALLVSPILFVAAANILGYWPYGEFRTNLFLIPSALLVTGIGLDELANGVRARAVAYMVMLAICIAGLPRNPGYFKWKWMGDGAPAPQLTEVLDEVLVRQILGAGPDRNVLIADWHSWRTFHYYLGYHPDAKNTYASIRDSVDLVRGPLNGMPALERLIEQEYYRAVEQGSETRVWVVVTKLDEFARIHSSPLVSRYGVYRKEFATHEPRYHPELIELQFERPPGAQPSNSAE